MGRDGKRWIHVQWMWCNKIRERTEFRYIKEESSEDGSSFDTGERGEKTMRKCERCGNVMVEDKNIEITGGADKFTIGYMGQSKIGRFLNIPEYEKTPKVAICKFCGKVELFFDEKTIQEIKGIMLKEKHVGD